MVAPVAPPRKHLQKEVGSDAAADRPPEGAPDVGLPDGNAAPRPVMPGREPSPRVSRTRLSTAPAESAADIETPSTVPWRRSRVGMGHQPDRQPRADQGDSRSPNRDPDLHRSGSPSCSTVSPSSTQRPTSSSGRGVTTIARPRARRTRDSTRYRNPASRAPSALASSIVARPHHPDRVPGPRPRASSGCRTRPRSYGDRPLEIQVPDLDQRSSPAATTPSRACNLEHQPRVGPPPGNREDGATVNGPVTVILPGTSAPISTSAASRCERAAVRPDRKSRLELAGGGAGSCDSIPGSDRGRPATRGPRTRYLPNARAIADPAIDRRRRRRERSSRCTRPRADCRW